MADNNDLGREAAAWRRDATAGEDSPYAFAGRYDEPVPAYRTLSYEVSGRVAPK